MAETPSKEHSSACGLYRTTLPLPEKEEQVPAGRLVYFHSHSEQGPPLVLMPAGVQDNRWAFANKGYLVRDAAWPGTLVSLRAQGLYKLRAELLVPGGKLPEGLLVQLGYTQAGSAVAFPAQFAEGNRIQFPSAGAPLTDLQLDQLEPADFKIIAAKPANAPAAAPGSPAAPPKSDSSLH